MTKEGYPDKVQHIRTKQLTLPFPEDFPEQREASNNRYIEQWIGWRYPMTLEEKLWLLDGVRLARFVPIAECKLCPLACEDHTQAGKYPSKVCLKDLTRR